MNERRIPKRQLVYPFFEIPDQEVSWGRDTPKIILNSQDDHLITIEEKPEGATTPVE